MINLERLEEFEKIAQQALDLPPDARGAFIASACKDDQELRSGVEAIVAASSTPTASFETAGSLGLLPPEGTKLKEGDIVSHFVIRSLLDEGGMGAVYVAYDTIIDRDVALKVLPARLSEVSRDKLGARFASAYIPALYESGETAADLTYIAMELVHGVPITTFCASLPLKARLTLFRDVCAGVAVVHATMIHRDLKPDNILVTKEGIPKILDFGTARVLSSDPTLALEPQPNDRFLSPEFASPEQLERRGLSAATDIYSLGVLLCFLLSGRLPYKVRSRAALPWAIANLEPERPSLLVLAGTDGDSQLSDLPRCTPPPAKPQVLAKRLSGDLDAIVLKCLQKKQKDRYLSVKDLSDDITNYFESRPVSARRTTVGDHIRKGVVRNWIALTVISGLLLFSAGLYSQMREARHQRDNARQSALQARESKMMLLKTLTFYDPELKMADSTIGEFIDRTALEIPVTMKNQPGAQVEIFTTLAQISIDRDMHGRAEQMLQTALSLCRKGLVPRYPSEADTLTWLGDLRREEGKLKEADDFLRQSIQIRQQAHVPKDDPDLLFTLHDLGQVEEAQFRMGEAEELYRRVLALRKGTRHPDRVAIAQSQQALGSLLGGLHRNMEAETLLRQSLALREAAFGHDHPLIANIMMSLAEVLQSEKRTGEAEALEREVVAMYKRLFGAKNHRTITATANLGSFLMVTGRPQEAVSYLQEALLDAKEVHHPGTVGMEMQLARALALTSRFDEADKLLDEAYSMASHSPDTPLGLLAFLVRAQGQVALKKGDAPTAETKLKMAVDMFLKSGRKMTDHVVVGTRSDLGEALAKRRRFAEAEPLLLAFLDVASPSEMPKALEHVIELYRAWGKTEKETIFRSRLLELGKKEQEKGSTATPPPSR